MNDQDAIQEVVGESLKKVVDGKDMKIGCSLKKKWALGVKNTRLVCGEKD